jgi:uncharacterized protein YbbC (DUF1343 family)
MGNYLKYFIIIIIMLTGCAKKIEKIHTPIDELKKDTVVIEKEKVIFREFKQVNLGIDVLEKRNFDILTNKRVGLITNQTGVNNELKTTIDILHEAPNVELVALFGPEHGVRGDVEAGIYVDFYTDKKTNLPVFSLYGKTRKPTKEMLKNIDVIVYDIQDIGVRSYTFISTMGLAMEAAWENNIEFVVLDRPNPLGGNKIEGNFVEDEFISFISQFPIPYVYGLTCGELANLLLEENMLKISDRLKLTVVPMENWERNMIWENCGLEWILTSPHIPHDFSALYYPMTGILGELRSAVSIGVGYTLPFQVVGAEWIESDLLIDELNKMKIPGLKFRPITYRPYYAFGKGKDLNGIQIHIDNYELLNMTKTQFYIISALKSLYPNKDVFKLASSNEIGMFNKGIGTDKVYELFKSNSSLEEIFDYIDKDVESFQNIAKKYHMY